MLEIENQIFTMCAVEGLNFGGYDVLVKMPVTIRRMYYDRVSSIIEAREKAIKEIKTTKKTKH